MTKLNPRDTLMEQLRSILLRKDREELESLKETLNDKDLLSEKVSPIIGEHLTFFKQNFPREFQVEVEKIIEVKLKQSQEELINIIYPKLGLLIQRYIANEFQKLRERLDQQIKKSFVGRMRQRFTGNLNADQMLAQLSEGKIEEVYIIQRDSGLLLGYVSAKETIDKEVLAGMLTAIKAFAEDAFKRDNEELETIQYDSYEIFLQTFYSFYFALAIKGNLTADEKSKLSERIFQFAEQELNVNFSKVDASFHYKLKKRLEESFFLAQPIKHD